MSPAITLSRNMGGDAKAEEIWLGLRKLTVGNAALSAHLATVHGNYLAGDPACQIACKEQGNIRHFLDCAKSTERNALYRCLVCMGLFELSLFPNPARKFD